MDKKVVFAFDVESRGDDALRNGIVSVGVCVGRADRVEVLHQQRFDFAPLTYVEYGDETRTPRTQAFEERAVREFWIMHMDKLRVMEEGARDPVDQIRAFRALLDRYGDPVIISDNLAFDARMVNHYLAVAGLPSLSYDATRTQYRPLFDIDSYARGVERMDYAEMWVDDRALIAKYALPVDKDAHDHMPENDARVIYELHMHLVLKVAQKK